MRKPGKPVVFAGWICGNSEDKGTLRNLGVEGAMVWREYDNCRGKRGIFEYCSITLEVANVLMLNYPDFWPGCFTGLRADGEQTIDQPLWEIGHEILELSHDMKKQRH